MHVAKNWFLEGKVNQRAVDLGEKIPKERKVCCCGNGGDGEKRRFLEGKDERICFLFFDYVRVGQG
jgi:hypothetical protein